MATRTISDAEFRALNGNAPMYPGKANYWVVVVKSQDLLADPTNEKLANELVWKWWSDSLEFVAGKNLRAIGVYPANVVPKGRIVETVQPVPQDLDPHQYVYLALTWDHNDDGRTDYPWPWRVPLLGSWQRPYSGLVAVYQPGPIVEVPSAIDGAIWAASQALEQTADRAVDMARGWALPLMWVAAVGVLVSLWRRR